MDQQAIEPVRGKLNDLEIKDGQLVDRAMGDVSEPAYDNTTS